MAEDEMVRWNHFLNGHEFEEAPTPQLKSINFSAFSLLYGPTLTAIHVRSINKNKYFLKNILWEGCSTGRGYTYTYG